MQYLTSHDTVDNVGKRATKEVVQDLGKNEKCNMSRHYSFFLFTLFLSEIVISFATIASIPIIISPL